MYMMGDKMNLLLADEDDELVTSILEECLNDDNEEDDGDVERIFVDINSWRVLSNSTFKAHFRMDRTVFQRLIVVFGNELKRMNPLMRVRTPLDLCFLMGLWPLFNQDTYRTASTIFGKSKSDIHYHYVRLITVLKRLAPKYIKWPDEFERVIIKTHFEETHGYPGVVGCIDGVQIEMTAPLEQPERYYIRKHSHTVLVQAVCDHNLLYRDVYVGEAGSIGDARNFKRSPLSLNLLTRPDMLSDGEHVLGDGAYRLSRQIITPYVNDGHMTRRQRVHNFFLSRCRSFIERSFARLRGKHRRLKKLPMRNLRYTIYHIVACFVLHNFILLDGLEIQGLPARDINPVPAVQLARLIQQSNADGALKREYIANLLHRQ